MSDKLQKKITPKVTPARTSTNMPLREKIARAVFKANWSDDPGYTWETSCADDRTEAKNFAQAIINELGLVEETRWRVSDDGPISWPAHEHRYVTAWEAVK